MFICLIFKIDVFTESWQVVQQFLTITIIESGCQYIIKLIIVSGDALHKILTFTMTSDLYTDPTGCCRGCNPNIYSAEMKFIHINTIGKDCGVKFI